MAPQGGMGGLEGSMEAKGVIGGGVINSRGVMKFSVSKVYINLTK